MEILNLDELATPQQSVTLKGVRHQVKEPSVEDFIYFASRENEAPADPSVAESVTGLVEVIDRRIPTIGINELRAMPFAHLMTIHKFLAGTLETPSEDQADPKQ